MLNNKKILNKLDEIYEFLNNELEYKKNRRRKIVEAFLSGIAKGLGISIGIVILGSIAVMILKDMVSLPVIGKYIAEIVEMVEIYTK